MLLSESCGAMLECNLTFLHEAYKVSGWMLVFREDIIVWVSGGTPKNTLVIVMTSNLPALNNIRCKPSSS
jgi:hypothetical protein